MRLMTTSLLLLVVFNQLSEANNSSSSLPKQRKKRWVTLAIGAASVAVGAIYGGVKIGLDDKRHRQQMAQMREQSCYANCVGEWSPWSQCSELCGGGIMKRSRKEVIPSYCHEVKGFSCGRELLQRATCNPGCPHAGWPKMGGGGCNCPDERNGGCCEREVRCDYPGIPEHGDMDGIFPAVYGTVVTYSCNEGYKMLNGVSEIQCLKKGVWSGTKPECVALQCDKPSHPANGRILNDASTYFFNQEIMYTCDEGYVMVGPNIRMCSKLNEEAAWTGFSPMCVETSCGDPGYPLNGKIEGRDFSLDGTVQMTCQPGYRLVGSTERRCLASGRWTGHETQCLPISCEPPVAPMHGRILPAKSVYVFGRYVTVRCDPGYQLKGKQKLKCIHSNETIIVDGGGMWDYETPACEAVSCGDPGTPQQGAKDSNLFMYPHNVTFTCFAGYTLRGAAKIHCDSTGMWSSLAPSCVECPKNTYKANTHTDFPCEPCPANTHTVTAGSTNRDQCVCNHGYKANSQGICQEIRCQRLSAPSNGLIAPCDIRQDSICLISCNEGFVMKSGAGKRQCLEDGSWSGTDAVCLACPINTYKGDERICVPCPLHSHTTEVGQSEGSCICDDGFETEGEGGLCVDVNECEENGGSGPCSDMCINLNGDYACDCSIPGYIINPMDRHDCMLEDTCRNLTENDAPKHGGLVCHWYREENSQFCALRCNQGYEFPAQVNSYEYCGPATDYLWSYEVRGEVIEDCFKEFFADVRLEADSFYFTRDCTQLTEAEKLEVKQHFADLLTEENVCMKRNTRICDVKNVGIICGETKRRRRRSVDGVDVQEEGEADEVTIQMDIRPKKLQNSSSTLDCDEICPSLNIPEDRCSSLCVKTYKRYLKAVAIYSKRQLETLYRNPSAVNFVAAGRPFKAIGVSTKDPVIECETGMRSENGLCVPCSKGSYHDPDKNECTHCSPGYYQPLEMQMSCLPCPSGTTNNRTRATSCEICASETYGIQCRETCGSCVNGHCHPVTGQCVCESGWEGDACDIDIQGCTLNSCYPGVPCWDIVAPATGFACGRCPQGTRGDGIFCEIIPFDRIEL